jgi:hypothetical protein
MGDPRTIFKLLLLAASLEIAIFKHLILIMRTLWRGVGSSGAFLRIPARLAGGCGISGLGESEGWRGFAVWRRREL